MTSEGSPLAPRAGARRIRIESCLETKVCFPLAEREGYFLNRKPTFPATGVPARNLQGPIAADEIPVSIFDQRFFPEFFDQRPLLVFRHLIFGIADLIPRSCEYRPIRSRYECKRAAPPIGKRVAMLKTPAN